MQRRKENQPAFAVTQLDILNLRYYTASGTVRAGTLLLRGVFQHFEIPSGAIKTGRREYHVFTYFMLRFSDQPAGCPRANGAKRRSGRKPGARVTNSAQPRSQGLLGHGRGEERRPW